MDIIVDLHANNLQILLKYKNLQYTDCTALAGSGTRYPGITPLYTRAPCFVFIFQPATSTSYQTYFTWPACMTYALHCFGAVRRGGGIWYQAALNRREDVEVDCCEIRVRFEMRHEDRYWLDTEYSKYTAAAVVVVHCSCYKSGGETRPAVRACFTGVSP